MSDELVEVSIVGVDGTMWWKGMGRGLAGLSKFKIHFADYEWMEFYHGQGATIRGDVDIRIRKVEVVSDADHQRRIELALDHDRAVVEERRKEDEDRDARRIDDQLP